MSPIWWLASYPKSGNTWLRIFLASLVSGRAADINALPFIGRMASAHVAFDAALGISSADLSLEQQVNLRPRAYEVWAAEADRPLYCKAHDAYHLTPSGEPLFPAAVTRGAIYVVRDPRAVAVSFASLKVEPIDRAIARMDDPNHMLSGSIRRLQSQMRQRLLRWSEHVESWLAAPFPVHLLRYEDMHADPHAAFAASAAFLGLPHGPGQIAAAVAASSFSRLQAQEREQGFVEKPQRLPAFFREGRTDGWRRALTPEQAARIVAAHGRVMRRLGYDVTLGPLAAERGAA
jgi:aryl sulfotransferase